MKKYIARLYFNKKPVIEEEREGEPPQSLKVPSPLLYSIEKGEPSKQIESCSLLFTMREVKKEKNKEVVEYDFAGVLSEDKDHNFEESSKAHWSYTKEVIYKMLDLAEYLYIEAMKHGYKHGKQESKR